MTDTRLPMQPDRVLRWGAVTARVIVFLAVYGIGWNELGQGGLRVLYGVFLMSAALVMILGPVFDRRPDWSLGVECPPRGNHPHHIYVEEEGRSWKHFGTVHSGEDAELILGALAEAGVEVRARKPRRASP